MTMASDYRSVAPAAAQAAGAPFAPGAPILRRVPLPAAEPPFDDELATRGAPSRPGSDGRVVYLPRPGDRSSAPGGLRTGVLDDVAAPAVAAVDAGAPPTAAPARLRLVGAPTSRAGRRSPARPLAGTGAAHALHRLYEPAGTPPSPGPAAGFGPGPVVCVDSATQRSRLLGSVEDLDPARTCSVPPRPLGDPRPVAAQVIQAVVEVLAGDRQVTQLTAWVDEEVYAAVVAAAPDLSTKASTLVRRPSAARIRLEDRPIVRSVHVSEPAAGVAEVIARFQTGARSRAIALRLEQWRGRWRCNALTVG